ncbi:hypothetical protein RBH20_19385 [Haloarcula sp. H-GB4]|uniref:hypothetical protein n=1 Tax=Haloarcula sp. H-GB4 TaxID=3069755 RepID=UPI0027B0310B|nr:hypothetical protein [Haloarcula sp. H-GB4]MDQ2074695.1 hypothetical protein [Haloarcula sp. H-GB4]
MTANESDSGFVGEEKTVTEKSEEHGRDGAAMDSGTEVQEAISEKTRTGFDGVSEATDSQSHNGSNSANSASGGSKESSTEADSFGAVEGADSATQTSGIAPPQQTDPTELGALSIPNYAQDLIDFEFVLEAKDDTLPTGVDGAGMIVKGEDEYVGITEVRPRSWSIHTGEKKSEIIEAFKSSFLATLDFPIQIVAYPTKFDISDHVERLNDVISEGRHRSTDSKLVNLGRRLYPNWLERFILDNDMKQRRFFIVIPISAEQINQFQNTDSGLLDMAAEKFGPLAPIADFFSSSDNTDISTQQCLRELDTRLNRVERALQRFDVQTERLDDRDQVMSVLYHYYNNEQPLNDVFLNGPYSVESGDEQTLRTYMNN